MIWGETNTNLWRWGKNGKEFVYSYIIVTPKLSHLKTFFCLTVSVGQKCWHGLDGYLSVLQGLSGDLSQGVSLDHRQLGPHEFPCSLSGGLQDSVPHWRLAWGSPFLTGGWPEPALRSLPHGPFQCGSSLHPSPHAEKARGRVPARQKAQSLKPTHGSDIPSQWLPSLHENRVTRSCPYTEEGIFQGCEHQGWALLGVSVEAAYPNRFAPPLPTWNTPQPHGKLKESL